MLKRKREEEENVHIKQLQQTHDNTILSDGEVCNICGEGHSDEEDTMIFCDGCNLALHTTCYFLDGVPDTDFFCQLCQYKKTHPEKKDIRCCICFTDYIGIMLEAEGKEGSFVHSLCVGQIQELYINNGKVSGINKLNPGRYKLVCEVCMKNTKGEERGACNQCAVRSCNAAFHAPCAKKSNYLVEYKEKKDGQVATQVHCRVHSNLFDKENKGNSIDLSKPRFQQVTSTTTPTLNIYNNGIPCCICDSKLSDEADTLICCKTCNMSVHHSCYQFDVVPPQPWQCLTCAFKATQASISINKEDLKCAVCPFSSKVGGAMLPTEKPLSFAHINCAVQIPELYIKDSKIYNIENIHKSRFEHTCSLCKLREGPCLVCVGKGCKTTFHPMCAKFSGFLIKNMKSKDGITETKIYCNNHPKDKAKLKKTNNNNTEKETEGTVSQPNPSVVLTSPNEILLPSPPPPSDSLKQNILNRATTTSTKLNDNQSDIINSVDFWKTVVNPYFAEPDYSQIGGSQGNNIPTTHDGEIRAITMFMEAMKSIAENAEADMDQLERTSCILEFNFNRIVGLKLAASTELNSTEMDSTSGDNIYDSKREMLLQLELICDSSNSDLRLHRTLSTPDPKKIGLLKNYESSDFSCDAFNINLEGEDLLGKEMTSLIEELNILEVENKKRFFFLTNSLIDYMKSAIAYESSMIPYIVSYTDIASKLREAEKAAQRKLEEEMDAVCMICSCGEVEYGNQIIFCDGCNVSVHQKCYKVSIIPEGDWFCQKCDGRSDTEKRNIYCVLCPSNVGAFSFSSSSKVWVHNRCALFLSSSALKDFDLDAGVNNILTGINSNRGNQNISKCSVCKRVGGNTLQCSENGCEVNYHVCCATETNCVMRLKEEAAACETYCIKHSRHITGKVEKVKVSSTSKVEKWTCKNCFDLNEIPAEYLANNNSIKVSSTANSFAVFSKATEKVNLAQEELASYSSRNFDREMKVQHDMFVLKCRAILSMIVVHDDCNKSVLKRLKAIHEKLNKSYKESYFSSFYFSEDVINAIKRENLIMFFKTCMTNMNAKQYSLSSVDKVMSSANTSKKQGETLKDLWCVCKKPFISGNFMVCCDYCDYWYHPPCLKYSKCTIHVKNHCMVLEGTEIHRDLSKPFLCPACVYETESGLVL